jgi:hypothetical protein
MTDALEPGGEATDLTLGDVLAGAAEDLPDIAATTADGVTTWRRGERPFATLSGDRAEFRLDPLVARAALRTPDTGASQRGPDWVTFGPAIVDDGAVDRAEAWFLSAHRKASAGG